ncbi:MAG TPA: hypothetical protein VH684_16230 [Xanthobacteraceae bacterium]|jgi:hypothetical protein
MRSKRAVAYLGFASVIAACAGTVYDALHPSPAGPAAVLIWPSRQPVSKPLLPEHAHKTTMAVEWNPVWPPDASTAAVPFFNEMVELFLATEVDERSAVARTEAREPKSQTPQKPPAVSEAIGELGWPFADSPEASGGHKALAQQSSERRHASKKNHDRRQTARQGESPGKKFDPGVKPYVLAPSLKGGTETPKNQLSEYEAQPAD